MRFPLGSGLYDMPEQPSAFGLGSGLFGQQMPAPQQSTGGLMGLFGDPKLQMGMQLLGAARSPNPWGTMAQSLMDQQVNRQEMEHKKRQSDLYEKQILQSDRRTELDEKRYGLEEAELGFKKTKSEREQAQFERQQRMVEQIIGQLGIGKSVQPAGATQPQAAPTSTEVDQYGTPVRLLDNLERTESSGNPRAFNPTTQASGAYQFIPSTTKMLNEQGIKFNPWDREQARGAASQYLQMLRQQHGGSWEKALAAYGGFKTKDPTPYVSKVLDGVPIGQPPQQPQPPQGGPSGLDYARTGAALELAGVQGGSELVRAGGMMMPKLEGGFYHDPVSGQIVQLPDKYKEHDMRMTTPGGMPPSGNVQPVAGMPPQQGTPAAPAGMTPRDVSEMQRQTYVQEADDIRKQYNDKLSRIPETLGALQTARQSIPKAVPFVGSAADKKLAVAKFLNHNLGWMGVEIAPDAVQNAEVLRSQLFQPILDNLKALDAQPTAEQQKTLQKAMGELGTDPRALDTILSIIEERLTYRATRHNDTVKQATARGIPFGGDYTVKLPEKAPAAPEKGTVENPMSTQEWLQQYRPQGTRRISNREVVGKIKY